MTKREEQWLLRGYKPTRFKAADSVYKLRFADAAVLFITNLIHSRGEWHNQDTVKTAWESLYRVSSKSQSIAALEERLTFKTVSIPPEQAQFLKARKFQLSGIS